MKQTELLADILRFRVFVSSVTDVEVQLNFHLFGNKGQRPKKDVFEVFFIAAGTLVAYNFTDIVNLLLVIYLIVFNYR